MSEKFPDDGELLDLERRLRAADSAGFESGAINRIRNRVRNHAEVGARARSERRGWFSRITPFAVVAVPVAAAAAIAAAVILGAPKNQSQVVQPAGSPGPSPISTPVAAPSTSPTPATPATPTTFLVEVAHPANASGPTTIHWVSLEGKDAGSQQLPANEAIMGAAGGHVLVYRADGHVLDLHMDGTAQDVGSGLPKTTASGQASVPVRVAVSPDGARWIWGEMVGLSGSSVHSRLWLAGIGLQPKALVDDTEDSRAIQPYSWTLDKPLVTHAALGIGGYILFDYTHGPVDQLDPATGRQIPVGPSNSADNPNPSTVLDLASNGAVGYISSPTQGMRFLTVNGPGQRGLGFALPNSGQAGGVLFDPSNNHLVYCTSPAGGPPHEQFETDIVDLNKGGHQKLGPADLRPQAWTPDGQLVEVRTPSDGDGAAATYLVSVDGTATKVSSFYEFVGIVRVTVS